MKCGNRILIPPILCSLWQCPQKVVYCKFDFFPAGESLDLKKDEPGDDLAQSENNESRNTKGSDGGKEISDADTEMHPSFLMANDKDSSTVDKCKSSSIIPEPPSSPSLASLPDEDDELTPSLGLENDDWVIVVHLN